MAAAGQGLERRPGVLDRRRLVINPTPQRDDGVDAQHRPLDASVQDRGGLAVGVLDGDLVGRPRGELLDVRHTDVEGDAQLVQDRPALWGAGRED